MKQIEAERVIKQRVLDALNECKVSVNKLAASFEARQTTLNDQINGSSKISAATLIALADFCPDISAEWLLRGTGEMLSNTATSPDVAELKDQLRRKDREIDGLYERIEELKRGIVPQGSVAAE